MKELFQRIHYWQNCDRIGPDIPLTHWQLYFPKLMHRLCSKKFGKFGQKAEFRPGSYAINCKSIFLGDRVVIRPNSMLFADSRSNGLIEIGDGVLIGSGVHIYVSNHKFESDERLIIDQGHHEPKSVKIEKGAWIGANVIVLPGVTVGENAVVAAGSVVTKNVGAFTLVAGNPASLKRQLKT